MKLFYDFIFILGFFTVWVYLFILFKSKEKRASKSILMGILVLVFFVLLESYSYIHKLRIGALISFLPAYTAKLIIGPLLLLYVRTLFYKRSQFLVKELRLFTPFLVFLIFLAIPIYIYKVSDGASFVFFGKIISGYNGVVRIFSDCIFLTYLYLGLRELKNALALSKNKLSFEIEGNFIWVRYVFTFIIVVISLDIFFASSQILFDIFHFRTQNLVVSSLVISLFIMAYYGTQKSTILIPYFLLEEKKERVGNKSVNSNLNTDFKVLEEKLQKVMGKEKLYLNPELTLDLLAKEIGTTNKKLSALFNKYLSTTFYDFINSHRIKTFKQYINLSEYKNLTIEGLAYECGFKSKASFYRVFKKETGMSPTQYKNTVK
ncbi:helix-turn-helix domain-containing protein [Tenacibaculum sp. 190524A02b]|uniref:helix-turn-helix domain-containing protein n=1 Tax=Tenacibaculum vairaonense TaxID=3137860 RepID=UPI0032B2598B